MKDRFFRWPNFKVKALTLSYDDGTVYDKKLIDIMSKHGIRGTFNISSGGLRDVSGFEMNLSIAEAQQLYYPSGNEVALHGCYHLSLAAYGLDEVIAEVYEDRKTLEKYFGGIIRGMAYANGSYTDEVVDCLAKLGIKYSRTCEATNDFRVRKEWLKLRPTCHHSENTLFELCDKFLAWNIEEMYDRSSIMFYVWGHSYEFENDKNWDRIEKFCEKVGNNEQVWYATNTEIYDYVKAYESLDFSADGTKVYNPTAIDIYFEFNRKNYKVKSGETLIIER